MSRVASRVRSPGSFTCTRCPAGTAALDAVPEAYHNPAAVWWGVFASSRSCRTNQAVTDSGQAQPAARQPPRAAPMLG